MRILSAGLIAGVLLQYGCAAPVPPAAFEHRDTLGVVAIVPARYVPASNFVAFAKSKPAGAAKVSEIESTLHDALARLDTQRGLAQQVSALSVTQAWLARREPNVAGPAALDDMPSYANARVDTVIEIAVREVGFESCGAELARRLVGGCRVDAKNPVVALVLLARARVVRVADGTPLYARQFRYASPQRGFARWTADGARMLSNEFERGYRELAERIVDEVLLLPPIALPNFQSNGRLPGTDPLYGVCWLAPVHPKAQPLLLSEALQGIVSKRRDVCPTAALHFASVDSLRPTLRWSAFPRDLDRATLDPASLADVSDVSYELRLWEADGCERGRLVLERSGLALPEHRIEEPLVPGQRYFWSFRARFALRGQPMATPWSLFDPLSCEQKDSPEWQYHRFVAPG